MSNTFKIGDRVRVVKDCDYAKVGMVGNIIVENNGISKKSVGVKFDESFLGGHGCAGQCEYGYGHWVHPEDLQPISRSQKVVITADDKSTFAKLYDGREVIKSAEAKCSPKDEFNFETGAKLAFDRLFDHAAPKYKVGDIVRILKDLKPERYTSPYGGWDNVVDSMMELAGKEAEITKAFDDGTYHIKGSFYNWVDTMFESLVDEPKDEPKYYNGKIVCIKRPFYFCYRVGHIYEVKNGQFENENGAMVPDPPAKSLEEINKAFKEHVEFVEAEV